MLPQNEGTLDRIVRAVVGVGLGILTFASLTGVLQIIAGVVAAVLLVTAVVGFCPLYALLRLNTNPRRASHT